MHNSSERVAFVTAVVPLDRFPLERQTTSHCVSLDQPRNHPENLSCRTKLNLACSIPPLGTGERSDHETHRHRNRQQHEQNRETEAVVKSPCLGPNGLIELLTGLRHHATVQ